ncbi:GNAT family N-acetyltransferase [Vallitalea pronyensis]|uniref:GNAT family N-acetyltransferase n=1 Tax=Vallitalea pronyensis TaxID=1348613 RepID=A0A8J8MFJ8_9FIRM|nr:bifunctional GNAT family N-acetyltransferase/class I SAM-dependent methyltransferase [Vallitalea pronyensis]QUI20852.1 GNAT family N-acetyltransferase [Vallitalea pronyensis]
MEHITINPSNDYLIYNYMKRFEGQIPYMLPTTYEQFSACLWHETLEGCPIYQEQSIQAYVNEKGHMVGFIQYGLAGIHYDEQGEKHIEPELGNIRHLYFNPECHEAGVSLLEEAFNYFNDKGMTKVFAFDHIAGMSCYARHGKLHESMDHVKKLLIEYGLMVHHENVYYVWDMCQLEVSNDHQVKLMVEQGDERTKFSLVLRDKEDEVIGYGEATDLAIWGSPENNAYLRYITIDEKHRGKGYSKVFMNAIGSWYAEQGKQYLHCDTSLYNKVAQGLYEGIGMERQGVTYDFNGDLDKVEEMGEFFNNRAESYEQHMARTVAKFHEYYNMLASPMHKTDNVVTLLDLGCGTGLELKSIFNRCPAAKVTGIDLSHDMLEVLRQNYAEHLDQITLIMDSYSTYPYEEQTYDYVISSMTMHHFLEKEKGHIYKKIYQGLSNGGLYIEGDYVVDEEEERKLIERYHQLKVNRPALCHIDIPFTLEHQIALLNKVGFDQVDVVWSHNQNVIIKAHKR